MGISLLFVFISILIVCNLASLGVFGKQNVCYQPKFIKTSWTDRRPEYVVNMTFNPNGTVTSVTEVNEIVENPFAGIALISHDLSNDKYRTVYNVSAKLCEFKNLFHRVPMFKAALYSALKNSNISFDCPMKVGRYIMDGMQIRTRNPFFSLMYQPKTSFIFNGGLWNQLSNGTLLSMSTYYFEVKLVKKDCGKSQSDDAA